MGALVTLLSIGCSSCSKDPSSGDGDGGGNSGKVIYTVDIGGMNDEERVAVIALQGLVNRGGTRIMVEPKNAGGFYGTGYQNMPSNIVQNGIDPISEARMKYASIEDVWKEFYKDKYDYSFVTMSFQKIFEQFADAYKGVVVYESLDADAGIAIATTACGVLDGVPVTESLMKKYPFLADAPVLENLTEHGFASRVAAHEWAVAQYLDKCSTKGAYSYWAPERNYFTIDYAVNQKLFSFSLRYDNAQYCEEGYTYDPAEVEVMDRIFAHLDLGSNVFGWGMSPENVMQGRIGQGGHVLICTNASPNLSFHANLGIAGQPMKQKRQPHDVTLENKVYITFTSHEGDTYKCLGNLVNDGMWLHDRRGDIPFNWAMNPQLLTLLPGLADYYYTELTDNDYVISPTTGLGHYDATYSTEEMRTMFASRNREYFNLMDQHYMDIWWNNFEGRDEWIASMGVDGFTTWVEYETVNYTTAVTNIESEMYYDLYWPPTEHDPEVMAAYILGQGNKPQVVGLPWFIHVYACDPTFAYRVMQNLPADRFEAVCMDDFFALAELARPQIEGITLREDTSLITTSMKDQLF